MEIFADAFWTLPRPRSSPSLATLPHEAGVYSIETRNEPTTPYTWRSGRLFDILRPILDIAKLSGKIIPLYAARLLCPLCLGKTKAGAG